VFVVAVDHAHLVGVTDQDAPGLRVVVLVEEELRGTGEMREAEDRCSSMDTGSGYKRRHRSEEDRTVDPKRIVEDGYDRLGFRYRDWTTSHERGVREWFLDEVLQRLPADADVLELGCGPATVSPMLADGRRYSGVDLSAGQLSIARERLPDATFIQGDFTTIELPSAAFDAVVAFYVFNHVPRAEHRPTFSRVCSWLRPRGRFMLSLGAGDTDDEIEEDWLGVPMFFAGFTPDANERSLLDAGFELELSETRSEFELGEGEATFHWVIARKPSSP
jgi:SAM-dependent methyltransferase